MPFTFYIPLPACLYYRLPLPLHSLFWFYLPGFLRCIYSGFTVVYNLYLLHYIHTCSVYHGSLHAHIHLVIYSSNPSPSSPLPLTTYLYIYGTFITFLPTWFVLPPPSVLPVPPCPYLGWFGQHLALSACPHPARPAHLPAHNSTTYLPAFPHLTYLTWLLPPCLTVWVLSSSTP